MSENRDKLQALIRDLNKQREGYTRDGVPAVQEFYRSGDRQRAPEVFVDSSFLYIRSYDGDTGNRPLPPVNFWNTPDISFTPLTGTIPLATNELQAGQTYQVRCLLRNRGDVTVPYPKVEFFVGDPSLGFDSRFATYLGVTQMDGLLLPNGTGEAQFVYRVPPEEAGHKCFFARTFSFSPLDKPHDVFALDPVNDRHTGQKNLHIVAQGSAYKFSLVHLANAEETIQIVPMGLQEIFGIGDPALGKLRFREGFPADFFYGQELEVFSPTQNVQVRSSGNGFTVNAQGEGPGVREQAEIMRAFSGALREIEAGKKPSEFKEVFAARRNMNAFVQKTTLTLKLPFLQLQQGEALAWKITNTNNVTGEVRGGITMIMTGMG